MWTCNTKEKGSGAEMGLGQRPVHDPHNEKPGSRCPSLSLREGQRGLFKNKKWGMFLLVNFFKPITIICHFVTQLIQCDAKYLMKVLCFFFLLPQSIHYCWLYVLTPDIKHCIKRWVKNILNVWMMHRNSCLAHITYIIQLDPFFEFCTRFLVRSQIAITLAFIRDKELRQNRRRCLMQVQLEI